MTRRMIACGGRTQSIAAWARELGISRQALSARIRRAEREGTPLEVELDPQRARRPRTRTPHKQHKRRRDAGVPRGPQPAARLLTHDGRRQTVAQWARELGLNTGTILRRLHRLGWTVERTLTTPARAALSSEMRLTHAGRTQSIAAWAAELGLSVDGLRSRIARWGVARALSTPRRPQGRKRRG